MANEFDETNRRPQQRDSAHIWHQMRRRRTKTLRLIMLCAMVAVCCLVLAVVLIRGARPDDSPSGGTTGSTEPSTTAPSQSAEPIGPDTVIQLVFGGDLTVTDKVVSAGETNGSYDYTALLMDVAPILADAHAAFLNLEGNLCGAPYGSGSASAPQALADALASAGVDFIQLANSYTIANGLSGLSSTAQSVYAAGMRPVGVFPASGEYEEAQGFTLVNIGGIRVAIVAFTKGMDGMSLPVGSEGCVNLLYTDYATTYQKVDEDGIRTVLQAAESQQPDLTIALVHWGSEYNDTISPTQKAIITLMQEEGVDAIVGTHSHFVQPIDYDADAGTVVAYSLGDLLGNAEKSGTNYSILLQLEITRDGRTGETRITGCDYTGVYVLTPEKDNETMRLVRMDAAIAMYESNHVNKVSDLAYSNICYAWERIQTRTIYKEDSKS